MDENKVLNVTGVIFEDQDFELESCEVLNEEDIKSDNMRREEDIDQLEVLFQNDILYKMLEKEGFRSEIISDEFKVLKIGFYYTPDKASKLTGCNGGTIRSWITGRYSIEIANYIGSNKRDKFHVLDAEAVFRIRLIHLIITKLKFSLTQIGNISVGKGFSSESKVITTNQVSQIAEIEKEDRFDVLEKKIQKMEKSQEFMNQIFFSTFQQLPDGNWKPKLLDMGQVIEEKVKEENIQGVKETSEKETIIESLKENYAKTQYELIEANKKIQKMKIESEVRMKVGKGIRSIFSSKEKIEREIEKEVERIIQNAEKS